MSETELMPCAWAVIDNETGRVSALYKTPTKAVALSFQSLVPLYRRSPEGGVMPKDDRDILERLKARATDADFAELMEDSVTKRRLLLNRQIDLDAIAEIERLRGKQEGASNTGEQK